MLVVFMSCNVAMFFLLLGVLIFLWLVIQMFLSFAWYAYWSFKSGANFLWNGFKAALYAVFHLCYSICCCCFHSQGIAFIPRACRPVQPTN